MSTTAGTLYVYGDSYSDTTNRNRRTNGPVWSERVAKGWGFKLQSYALLASRTCRASDTESPSIAGQVELYRNSIGDGLERQVSNSKDVHAFFIGVTDITNSTKYEAINLVGCIKQQISNLQQANPNAQVLLLGIPPLEYSPFYANNTRQEQIKTRVNEYNVALEDAVTEMKDDLATPLSFIDNNYLFADILGNPDGYGLDDVDHAYWDQCQGRCGDSMDSYLWWDSLHLTGAGHKAIADTIITKNPFNFAMDSTTLHSNGDNLDGDAQDSDFLTSSGDYVRYVPWFLLFCVVSIVFMMVRRKHGFHLRSLWKRRKNCDYTAVPV
ncbi:hypothetical protein BCR42DRAFT_400704 [Absidia repens]|uniref:Uncharacterized protein n=1 Tax=Absidia repens TaxID=90262 RepID=A0A1X2J1G1_9FUNG|nr:hypothetical protein BCR42DRAFT_400704 [Absidia repens]